MAVNNAGIGPFSAVWTTDDKDGELSGVTIHSDGAQIELERLEAYKLLKVLAKEFGFKLTY